MVTGQARRRRSESIASWMFSKSESFALTDRDGGRIALLDLETLLGWRGARIATWFLLTVIGHVCAAGMYTIGLYNFFRKQI